MKVCSFCEEDLPFDNFYKAKRSPDGRYSRCKDCHRKLNRQSERLRLYGVSNDDYEALLGLQGGVCAICHRPETVTNRNATTLSVDHDHETGQVRGLLCRRCNLAIGHLDDNLERVRSAVYYLQQFDDS